MPWEAQLEAQLLRNVQDYPPLHTVAPPKPRDHEFNTPSAWPRRSEIELRRISDNGPMVTRVRWLAQLIENIADVEKPKQELCWTSNDGRAVRLSLNLMADRMHWLVGMDSETSRFSAADIPQVAASMELATQIAHPRCVGGHSLFYFLDDYDPTFPWDQLEGLLEHYAPQAYAVNDSTLSRWFNFDWDIREAVRTYLLGEEGKLPWLDKLPAIPGHFAHISKQDPTKVAFTENAAKGERETRVMIKPGRYLTRFYPDLNGKEVERYQAAFDNMNKLQFATESDDIVRVYTTGPRSCMSHGADVYNAGHPVRVFGSGSDITLAYLVDATGKPTARTLVWQDKKIWCRMYGDHARLTSQLDALGYKQGNFNGAKIHRITANKRGNEVVMPYLDLDMTFGKYDDKWLEIGGGDFGADNTCGTAEMCERYSCDECGERLHEDDTYSGPGGDGRYCESCYDEQYTCCERTGETVRINDTGQVIARFLPGTFRRCIFETWCEDARNNDAFYCDGIAGYVSVDASEPLEMHHGEVWSRYHFERENGVEVDGVYYRAGDAPAQESDDADADDADEQVAA